MLIYFQDAEKTLIATLVGELDHHSSEEVRARIDDRLDNEDYVNLIMDFDGISFMDSSGIGAVIGRYKKLERKNGKLIVTNVSANIKRIFDLSGLFKIVGLSKDVDEALKSL